jgi:predicted Ser/Thr protein kinase
MEFQGDVHQGNGLVIPSTGDIAEIDRTDLQIETSERPINIDEKAAALAFMEEIVTVMIHESTNPEDEQIVEVSNGGRLQNFIRGQPQQVRRKYVEVLARARKTDYRQTAGRNYSGEQIMKMNPSTALKYPFSVIHDPNPNGVAWLTNILKAG